ncbi:hypothetical protein XPA_010431 [Xanthoria parietina]
MEIPARSGVSGMELDRYQLSRPLTAVSSTRPTASSTVTVCLSLIPSFSLSIQSTTRDSNALVRRRSRTRSQYFRLPIPRPPSSPEAPLRISSADSSNFGEESNSTGRE